MLAMSLGRQMVFLQEAIQSLVEPATFRFGCAEETPRLTRLAQAQARCGCGRSILGYLRGLP